MPKQSEIKQDRIKEVKKICPRCKGTGRITWHNKQAGREFEGLDYEVPCPDCQLFPQPLGDKDLRREIAKKLWEHQCYLDNIGFLSHKLVTHNWNKLPIGVRKTYLDRADQTLALLQPKIEEALKEERKQSKYLEGVIASYEARATPEEAKRGERERILAEIEEKFMLQPNCFSRELHTEGTVIIHKVAWQALSSKGERNKVRR